MVFFFELVLAKYDATNHENKDEKKEVSFKDNQKSSVVYQGDLGYTEDECSVFPFNQTVTKNGCETKHIANNFCFGQCGSFIIPAMNPYYNDSKKRILRSMFEDCRQCVPQDFQLIKLPLYCPGRKKKHRFVKVLLIKTCICKTNSCLMT